VNKNIYQTKWFNGSASTQDWRLGFPQFYPGIISCVKLRLNLDLEPNPETTKRQTKIKKLIIYIVCNSNPVQLYPTTCVALPAVKCLFHEIVLPTTLNVRKFARTSAYLSRPSVDALRVIGKQNPLKVLFHPGLYRLLGFPKTVVIFNIVFHIC